MAVTVRIPTPLRQFTDGADEVPVEGATVGEVLQNLCQRFPELQKRLFREDGQLNRFVNIYVNNEDMRFLQELNTKLTDRDEVSIIQSVSGGR